MFVIIAGCGTVGKFLLDRFTEEDADITVIEQQATIVSELKQGYDVLTLEGDMLSHYVLRNANTAACDLFIACSNIDSVNIVACQLAKRLGAAHCVARVYSEDIFPIDIEQLEQHLSVDWLISPSRLAGFKFVTMLLEGKHVSLDSYFSNKLELARLIVSQDSNLLGKKVDKFFRSSRLNLIAITRNGQNILRGKDNGHLRLALGDEITVSGIKHKLLDVSADLYASELQQQRRIYIAGSSKPVMSVLQFLGARRKQAVLLEKDRKQAEYIKGLFNDLNVLHLDPASYQSMRAAQMDTNGVFVCGSSDDALNLTYALNAEELQFKTIIPIVHGIDKIRFFKRLHYEKIVCPAELAGIEIFRYFDENIKKDFDLIAGSQAKAIIKEIEEKDASVGKSLEFIREQSGPDEELHPIAVWRSGHLFLPHDKNIGLLNPGDRVLIASLSGKEERLLALLRE